MPRLLPIRGEDPPDDTVVIIRAGVMSADALRRTAADSFDDFGAYLVSVEAVVDGLPSSRPAGRVHGSGIGTARCG